VYYELLHESRLLGNGLIDKHPNTHTHTHKTRARV